MFGLFSKKIETCNTTGCKNPPLIKNGYGLKCTDCYRKAVDSTRAKRTVHEAELNHFYSIGDSFFILDTEFLIFKYRYHLPASCHGYISRIYVMECYYTKPCGELAIRTFDHSHIGLFEAMNQCKH